MNIKEKLKSIEIFEGLEVGDEVLTLSYGKKKWEKVVRIGECYFHRCTFVNGKKCDGNKKFYASSIFCPVHLDIDLNRYFPFIDVRKKVYIQPINYEEFKI